MVLALEVLVGVAILAGVALVVSRDLSGVDDPVEDGLDIGLPSDRLLRSDDIDRLRFRVVGGLRGGIRGYRFTDVDAALGQVRDALRAHESRTAATTGTGPGPGSAPTGPPGEATGE